MTSDEAPPGTAVASYAQQRRVVAVCEGRGPASRPAAKNVPMLCHVPGRVDPDALTDAVRGFVDRHPILRYRFVHRDGEVTLCRADAGPADIGCTVVDRSALPAGDGALDAYLRAEVDRPFDVLGWPLLRAGLVQGERSVVYLSADHLVTDGWSMVVAKREIEALYQARRTGRAADLPEPGDFLGYSAQQRRRFAAGPEVDREVDGLRAVLDGRPLEPPFPLDLAHWEAGRGRYVDLDLLDADDTARLDRLCRGHRATLFMALLAAFGVAAHELSGRTEVGILVATHNRDEATHWNSVGWHANTLPLYFTATAADGFAGTLRAARDGLMRLLAWYDLPLARVHAHAPGASQEGVGERYPTCFMSFIDARWPPDPQPCGWAQRDLAPAHRMNYGIWVVRRQTGLQAVVASPWPGYGEARLAQFETRLAGVLRDAVRRLG